MPTIDQEMSQVADQLSKSAAQANALEEVMDRVMTLGPDQLRKAVTELSESQKLLLKDVLEKALKTRSINGISTPAKEHPANAAAEPDPKEVKDLDSHSIPKPDGGADDEDEKLMEEKNNEINHQGDASPEGRTGQKIEDPAPQVKGSVPADEEPATNGMHATYSNPQDQVAKDKITKSAEETDLQRMQKAAKNPDAKADAELGEKVERVVEQHMADNAAAEAKEGHPSMQKAKDDKHERCVQDVKREGTATNPWAVCNAAMKKASYWSQSEVDEHLKKCGPCSKAKGSMKKAQDPETETLEKTMKHDNETLKRMMYRAVERSMEREPLIKALVEQGHGEDELGKIWAEAEGVYKSKQAASAKVKKSIVWKSKTDQLLKASTRRGQNTHYDVADMIEQSTKETAEIIKKGAYLGEAEMAEALAKAKVQDRKISINELIEKGYDLDPYRFSEAPALAGHRPAASGTITQFDTSDIARGMNLSPEAAAKILGDPAPKKA